MKKTYVRVLISLLITLVLGGVYFYVVLPPLNIFSQGFWVFMLLAVVCFTVIYTLLSLKKASFINKEKKHLNFEGRIVTKIGIAAVALPIVVLIFGNLLSSTFFNAEAYSNVIEVPNAVFEEDMPENDTVSNIALMDSQTAQNMGKRTLGALSDVVSQYEINPTYRQINYQRTPQKVATLEYAGFFKWMSNNERGIPGYVMVDPVKFTDAKYVKFEKPIKYTDYLRSRYQQYGPYGPYGPNPYGPNPYGQNPYANKGNSAPSEPESPFEQFQDEKDKKPEEPFSDFSDKK